MKNKVLYIHTARDGRAVTRDFIISPQLQVYHFRFTGDSGSVYLSDTLIRLRGRPSHWMASEGRKRQEEKDAESFNEISVATSPISSLQIVASMKPSQMLLFVSSVKGIKVIPSNKLNSKWPSQNRKDFAFPSPLTS